MVEEDKQYTEDYLDPDKRSIANALQIFFKDGTQTKKVAVEYPLGHRRRRAEALPLLQEKLVNNLGTRFAHRQQQTILDVCLDGQKLEIMPVHDFLTLFTL